MAELPEGWEKQLKAMVFAEKTPAKSRRPERPDRPRRAPRRDRPVPPVATNMPPQCSSWDTFRDKPVRCELRVKHEKRHLAWVLLEEEQDYERHTW